MITSDSALLDLWESARGCAPLTRLRVLMRAAAPEIAYDDQLTLTLPACDFALLDLRRRMFGSQLVAQLSCPHCGEALEFDIDADRAHRSADALDPIAVGGLSFRLPSLGDVLAVAESRGDPQAIKLLARRCCVEGEGDIPDDVITEWDAKLASSDSATAIRLELTCAACGAPFSEALDMAAFLWTELFERACALLDDVHTLAMHYGWSEAAILGMGAARRDAYLERCGA